MLPIPRVYLDLDGVIRDFDEGIKKEFDITFKRDRGSFRDELIKEIKEKHNLNSKQLWDRLDIDFVANLPFTPHAKKLLTLLEPYKPIILTSPSRTNATGTQFWIRKKLPKFFFEGRYLIGPCKRACAHPMAILIDDYEKQIDEFRENDGHAILFPTAWNKNKHIDDPVQYTWTEFLKYQKNFFNDVEKKIWKYLMLDKTGRGMVGMK